MPGMTIGGFGEALTPQLVDDLLELQAVFATERTWCQPSSKSTLLSFKKDTLQVVRFTFQTGTLRTTPTGPVSLEMICTVK